MLIMHATVGGDPWRSTGLADVPCARATFYAHERLYVSSYYLYASPVFVGPTEVAVYGRTEELKTDPLRSLTRVSTTLVLE